MNASDKQDFVQLIGDALSFYKQELSQFALSVWWNGCQPYTLEQISKAITSHATDPERGQFAPKIADIVRQLQGTRTDRSLLAWGKTMEAMSRIGAYQDVLFDDAAIHAAIAGMGGWPKLCRTSMDELSYAQHRFCQSHKAYTERAVFDYPKALMGDRSPDIEYEKSGLKLPKPAIVGDVEKAKHVYLGGGMNRVNTISFAPIDFFKITNA